MKFLIILLSSFHLLVSCAFGQESDSPNARNELLERVSKLEKELKLLREEKLVESSSSSLWDLKLGGRVFNDWVSPEASRALENGRGPFVSTSSFRKARLVLKGSAQKDFGFKFELDFADGDADLTDVYIYLPGPFASRLQIGRQKEPFGLELKTSSRFLTFLERAPVSEILIPKRNTGVSINPGNLAPKPGFWLGYFHSERAYGVDKDANGHNLTSRFTTQAKLRDGGRELIHFGASYSRRDSGRESMKLENKVAVNFIPDV